MARLPLHRWRYSTRLLFSGCDREVYQQDLVIHRTAGQDYEEDVGGIKTWHIYIGPRCRPDYGDLRFTDRYGRELAYYLWPGYDAESARVCVRLEGADASGTLTAHYGNAAATTTSDGSATYLLFDHFDGAANAAPNPDIWEVVKKGSSSATVKLDGNGNLLLAGRSNTISSGNAWAKPLLSRNVIIEYRDKISDKTYVDTSYGKGGVSGVFDANSNSWWHTGLFSAYAAQVGDGTSSTGCKLRRTNPSTEGNTETLAKATSAPYPSLNTFYTHRFEILSAGLRFYRDGTLIASGSDTTYSGNDFRLLFSQGEYSSGAGGTRTIDYVLIRASSDAPPSLLRTSRGVNPAYAGLARLTGSAAADDGVIQFAGVGSILVVGDERETIAGAGSFAIETRVSSPIPVTTVVGFDLGLHVDTAPVTPEGVGSAALRPTRMLTPLAAETGVGTPYVAPTPVQFDVWQYRFESLEVSRSAQDALWRCDGQIDGLQAPLAYKSFTVRVPDHNGVLRTIFFGFVPGRDYVQAVAANKSTVQGFDAGFYLTRQYLPDGDLFYPAEFLWTPMNLIKYWLGEEATWAGSPSRWEQVTGIMPYRIHDPSTYYHPYTPKDWNFQPMTPKAQAIQEVCEYSGMVFLVKWRSVNGAMTPCAYLVHQDDIDHATHGLDLPPMVTFTHPDPHVMDGVRVTMRSDEKYNRIEVRSASPSGAWFHAVRETAALQAGEELPIEYLEERSDLPIDADHGGWCNARADELYAYYTAYSYTYTLTLIDRTDLELYQRCRFYGFGAIPDGDVMRIVAIRYSVRPTHTEVEIVVTPDSRLSDLRRLQRSQAADSVSEVQTIAQSQIDQIAAGEVGTVVGIDGAEAIVELERRAGSSVRGRIV